MTGPGSLSVLAVASLVSGLAAAPSSSPALVGTGVAGIDVAGAGVAVLGLSVVGISVDADRLASVADGLAALAGLLAVAVTWVALRGGSVPTVLAGGFVSSVVAVVTGAVGAVVAYQGYRGYRRNASRPMLFIALGVALLVVLPLPFALIEVGGAAERALAGTLLRIAGLLAVLYALTGA
jgi:hypothetical protein